VCGETVVAKKGEVLAHHFSHVSNSSCGGLGGEGAIHAFVKQTVFEKLTGPDHVAAAEHLLHGEDTFHGLLPGQYHRGGLVNGERTYIAADIAECLIPAPWRSEWQLEKHLGDFRPDIYYSTDEWHGCIEVVVSHDMDQERLEKSVRERLVTIRLDASMIAPEMDAETVWGRLKGQAKLSTFGGKVEAMLKHEELSSEGRLPHFLKSVGFSDNETFSVVRVIAPPAKPGFTGTRKTYGPYGSVGLAGSRQIRRADIHAANYGTRICVETFSAGVPALRTWHDACFPTGKPSWTASGLMTVLPRLNVFTSAGKGLRAEFALVSTLGLHVQVQGAMIGRNPGWTSRMEPDPVGLEIAKAS